jgi:hypothetical protein
MSRQIHRALRALAVLSDLAVILVGFIYLRCQILALWFVGYDAGLDHRRSA